MFIRITRGLESSCHPCYCQENDLRCEGRDIYYFPELDNQTKASLEYIFLVETYISYLPKLEHSFEYQSLIGFVELNNFVLSCASLFSWYITLTHTSFDTECQFPTRTSTTIATSVVQTGPFTDSSSSVGENGITGCQTVLTGSTHLESDVTSMLGGTVDYGYDNVDNQNVIIITVTTSCILLVAISMLSVYLSVRYLRLRKEKKRHENVRNVISQIYRDPNHSTYELYEIDNSGHSYC